VPIKDPVLRREMQKIYSQRWYLRNRKEQVAKSVKRKDRVRVIWNDYKAAQKCSHCGFQHPAVIDFHHVIKEGKKSVNKLATQHGNVRAAIREAEEKCIPLCSNCHRIFHWQEHKQRRKKRKWKSKTTY
jgi:predicted DsbA family dithiol-disulfide isomerase